MLPRPAQAPAWHAAALQPQCIPLRRAKATNHRASVTWARSLPQTKEVCGIVDIPAGQVTIQPLGEGEIQGAALLLTRAFAGTAEAVKLDEAKSYMQERLQRAATGTGLTLVARLVPTDPTTLPPGKDSRLVGTVSLSFTAASREAFESLAPPDDQPYLANMAVDPTFRRQGIARAMLVACDEAVQHAGQQCIWLHVRQADPPAQQLYMGYGYQEQDRDKPKPSLFGFGGGSSSNARPRILMWRQLAAAGSS